MSKKKSRQAENPDDVTKLFGYLKDFAAKGRAGLRNEHIARLKAYCLQRLARYGITDWAKDEAEARDQAERQVKTLKTWMANGSIGTPPGWVAKNAPLQDRLCEQIFDLIRVYIGMTHHGNTDGAMDAWAEIVRLEERLISKRRAKPAAERNRIWDQWHKEGLSHSQIVAKHKEATKEIVTKEAVRKALKRHPA
jgi:hypothetical protein